MTAYTNFKVGKLKYFDETWGSYRHWQIVDSLKEVRSIEEAKNIIENGESDGFKPCWEFKEIKREWDDSSRNRHRDCEYEFEVDKNKVYVIRRWAKEHPSGNRGKWLSGFIFAIIKDGKIVEIIDKRKRGL